MTTSSPPSREPEGSSPTTGDSGGSNDSVETTTPVASPPSSDFDKEIFQKVVADAGRWAYGVVFVEVWVMNHTRTHLVRPEGGFWVDQVSVDYGQNNNSKFQRLIDPSLNDYFPPTPRAPGVGIPGMLWTQASRGNVAVDSLSVRSGTIFAARNRREQLRRNRNRNLFPFETVRGGTLFGPSPSPDNVATQQKATISTGETSTPVPKTTQSDASSSPQTQTPPPRPRQRRSVSMDVGAIAASAAATPDSSSHGKRRHRRLLSDGPNISSNEPSDYEDVETGRWERQNAAEGSYRGPNVLQRRNLLPSEVRWRRISDLANDPDQPFNPRIHYLQNECELGFAAGVPFHIGASEGIVIYMARKTADVVKLVTSTNEEYLTHSSLMIGSAFALRQPRSAAEKERHQESDQTMRRLKQKMQALNAMNRRVVSIVQEESLRKKMQAATSESETAKEDEARPGSWNPKCSSLVRKSAKFLRRKVRSCCHKFWGSQTPPPPPFTWEQTFVTFVGSCVSLFVLISINSSVVETYGNEYGLVLGPFGALMTLVFSLTSAPASQPRNCILGQFVSLFIAYGIGRSPIDRRIKACISTSLSISLMARLGVTHPPAGASAMIFSAGTYSVAQIGAMLLGNVIAVLLASWFNNLSDKRQYPTAWFPLCDCLIDNRCMADERDKAVSITNQPSPPETQTVRAPIAISKKSPNSGSAPTPKVSSAAALKDVAKERNMESSRSKAEDRSSLLQSLCSFITGEASKATSLQHADSPKDDNVGLNRSKESDDDGTIDLAMVLAQAKNPIFVVDHGNSLSNQSVFRISAAAQHADGSLRYRQYVMNNHSQSDNSGTIDLSEVLATAAGHSDDHNNATNQSFVRSPENRSISLSTSPRQPDLAMVHTAVDDSSNNSASIIEA